MSTEPLSTLNQDLPLLESILRELDEALVACDRQGLIRLCNQAAQNLFRHHPGLAVGNSLYAVCQRGPIGHALRMLTRDQEQSETARATPDASLVCTTVDNTILLHCRIRPLTVPGATEPLLLLTFADLTRQLADQDKAGGLLPPLIEELRRPLSNLAAAAANLQNHPGMSPESRATFIEIVARESTALTDRFDTLVWQYRATLRRPWPLSDVNSADLFGCLVQRLAEAEGPIVTMTGEPLWLQADSYALLLALETLVHFIRELRRVREINLEALLGDRRVYLDLVWPGAPIPQAALNQLLQSPLPEGGGVTIAEVLWRHDSELWSQRHQRRGFSILRLPLPHSPRQWHLPAEPPPSLADQPLTTLDYVVFDTETTGLNPAGGDEILALTAVRISHGRILEDECFEQQVRPRQAFSAVATSDRAAPIIEVLPRFRDFIGEAIMVAHNAPFDLNFFRSQETAAGVRFDQPLLDTMLLSRLVDEQRTDLTLAGVARWLGLEMPERQTTMGDCRLTARIFVRLMDRLAAQGLTTLGQVLAASTRLLEKRAEDGTGRRDA